MTSSAPITGSPCRWGGLHPHASRQPFAEALHIDVEDRHKEDGQDGGGKHPTNDGGAQGLSAGGAGAARQGQGHHSQNEGKGGHEDGAEAPPGGIYGRLEEIHSLRPLLARHFHDENGILAGQGDQQDHPDLSVDVVVKTANSESQHCPEQGQRHHQNNGGRTGPAFVLSSQHQKHQEHGKTEHIQGLVADQLLLVGHAGPLDAHVGWQFLGRHLFHEVERLPRTEARCRTAADIG